MKHTQVNICKFITPRESGRLVTKNFIFERDVHFSGNTLCFETPALHLVAGGEGRLSMCGQVYPLVAGTVFVCFAHIPFVIESVDALNYFYISATGERLEELFRRFDITPQNCVFPRKNGLLPLWQDSIVCANDENIDLLSESLLLHTFSKFKRPAKQDDVVGVVKTYLEENFNDCRLTLDSLSQAAGYSPNYLSHMFKQKFGMSFSEYLRLLRMKHAVMLIENGVTSVKNVAALCGYSDPLYFSRLFRETVGVSPSHYAKRRGEEQNE